MKFKSGEIIGNITRHLPGGEVEVDYAGTLLTLPETDNELFETGGELDLSDENLKKQMENFDWSTFFNTPVDHVEYVNLETAISKEKIEKLNKLIDEKTVATENELAVWFNKSYKKNSSIVYGGGDDIHGTAMSIGGINEARKLKNITRLQHELLNLQKAKQILSSYNLEREGELHANLLSDYRRQDYIKPNGKKMSSEEQWQIDEGYDIIFNLLKTSFKRGGQVSNGPDLFSNLSSQLGFDISEFLDTPLPAPEPVKVKSADVESIPLSSIYTDEARFQNRDKLNQELVDHIAENWSDADQDPIHIWKDPKQKNKIFVLSGHHRYYGAKKANRKTVKIIDRSNDFDEQQAIKFAKEEANTNRTMETALERAKALRAKRLRGDSREEINQFLEREGKNKNYVNNLSFLGPNGKTLKTLEQFGNAEDKQLQKETEQRSDWIGEARRTILGLTDAHENELFDFLFDKSASKRVSTKAEFLQKVRSVVNPMQPDEPLNIARFKLQTQGEAAYDQMVADKKAAITERQDKINKLNDRFNNPYAPDFISTESPGYDNMRKLADSKISQLDVERKMLQKQLEDIYRDKMKYTAATTSGSLFLQFKTGGELTITDKGLKIPFVETYTMSEVPMFFGVKQTNEGAVVIFYGEDGIGRNPDSNKSFYVFTNSLNNAEIQELKNKIKKWEYDYFNLGIDLMPDEPKEIWFSTLAYAQNYAYQLYNNTNFKTGGELLPEINDLLGFSIDEFVDTDTLNTEFTPEVQPLSNPLQPPVKRTDKSNLQDYGEKIGGAKKDILHELSNITGSDLATQPLSKAFPAPDYKKLFEDGTVSQEGAILLKYMYDDIEMKPRKSYRIPRWINEVQTVINTFQSIIGADAPQNKEYADAIVDGIHSSKLLDGQYEMFYETMKGFDFPKNEVNLGKYRIRHFVRTGGYWADINGERTFVKGEDRYSITDSKYIIKDFPTMAEAIDGLKIMLLFNKEKVKAEGTKFSVYKDTKTLEFFIGKKGSIGVIRLIEGFKEGKAAFEFLKDNQLKLQGIWDGMKEVPDERNENNRPRIGVDWRKGEDITSEKIATTFNFRGVEFGNWVNTRERQDNVNEAYESLMDLASITGISPAALGLSGQLAFAFGARGSGKANAHYEPDKVVINLTKTRGSGSLAHEWWHALDNYFSRMRGIKLGHVTEIPRSQYNNGVLDTRVREEVFSAYKAVVQAIEKSGLPARSKILDGSRSKQYWSTIVEMSARAFENFVINKLSLTDQLNDYLANFKEMGQWIRDTNGNIDAEKNYPYPLEVESEAIDLAYQQFFDALQVKKDEATGKDVLFESGGEIENDIPDTMNTGYAARIQTNMQYIGSKLEDWRPVPIKGFVLTEGPKDKMVEMPEFEFPKGYDRSKTLYVSSQDSPCCELCGKSPIAKFFYIQNDKEKTTMITRSECVTHFGEGKSGKENMRTAKINLAIMMDHDLGILAKYIKDNYSYMHHIGYGRQERNWKSEYIGQSESDNNKKYDQIKDDDITILLNPKNIEWAKLTFKDEPKYIEQANYNIDWKYIHSIFPSFGWKNQLDLIKRNYDSQESAEKKLLTWYKKNEQSGHMLLEKVTKILKVLDKYDENVLNSEYLSAVNTV